MASRRTSNSKYSIFGLLNRIYSNPLLPNRVKHYYACRVFCLQYNAASVSILLYDGGKEKLTSKGIYFHRNSIKSIDSSSANSASKEELHMLRYLGFYHFLFSNFAATRLPEIVTDETALALAEEFLNRKYLSYDFPKRVDIIVNDDEVQLKVSKRPDKIKFVQFCLENSRKLATNKEGYLDTTDPGKYYYKLNQKLVSDEEYSIGPDVNSFSGQLYHEFVSNPSMLSDDDLYVRCQSEFNESTHYRTLKNNLAQVGLSFRLPQYYVGVPLIVNNRCIGILRMLYLRGGRQTRYPKTPGSLLYLPFSKCETDIKAFLSSKGKHNDFLYTVEVLGNILDQSYPQAFIEKIPRDDDFIFESRTSSRKNPFDEWCTSVQKAINCHGCVLRFADSPISSPRIMGYSGSITDFVNVFNNHNPRLQFIIKNGKFHDTLTRVFPSLTSDWIRNKIFDVRSLGSKNQAKRSIKKRIVAIMIDFGESYSNEETKIVEYFYVINNTETVRSTNNIKDIDEEFTRIDLIDELNPDNSFISKSYHELFTGSNPSVETETSTVNHKARYMLIVDVPCKHTSGVVTFSNSKYRRFDLSDVRFAYAQVGRLSSSLSLNYSTSIALFISNNLHRIGDLDHELSEMLSRINTDDQSNIDFKSLEVHAKKLQRRLVSLRFFENASNYIKELMIPNPIPYDLVGYLKDRIEEEYKLEAEEKGIMIDFFLPSQKVEKTTLNKECVWHSLEGILDNAIYRTPIGRDMATPGRANFIEGFRKNEPNVPGNISVSFNVEGEFLNVSVSNYGSSLKAPSIKDDKQAERPRMGLALVKLFLSITNSKYAQPVEENKKVTFTIKIRY